MSSAPNGDDAARNGFYDDKPLLELYVKASGIDSRRIGADLFCQEFWMELYALYEVGVVRVEVKTVKVNSEAFKKNFLGAQPPIMVESSKGVTHSDNRDIEGRIFHLAKQFHVSLFEKDLTVEKTIQNLYRNFKVFLQAKVGHDRQLRQVTLIQDLPTNVLVTYNKLIEQLTAINNLLAERKSRYLAGDTMTEYDCELMPRLHHVKIVGQLLLGFEIPSDLTHLWSYILTAYRTAAFIESCPADQDVLHHYKEQLKLQTNQRETLQTPTKSFGIPQNVLDEIRSLGIN
ncbi:unnamed protein product [Bursaphelenchus okinawaensis]|uniref:Chloride intracellular channel exc-4 n=1 Tax=Bursaphelenchus okinawaensis TaxID=465554 RepID=A0A811JUY0_9BILA|nr:unnamed protein product [Bursaphelenchus okinawaensis]CAG9084250.1 unnamed protein product [Bursaphelenchus okinawaensis]